MIWASRVGHTAPTGTAFDQINGMNHFLEGNCLVHSIDNGRRAPQENLSAGKPISRTSCEGEVSHHFVLQKNSVSCLGFPVPGRSTRYMGNPESANIKLSLSDVP